MSQRRCIIRILCAVGLTTVLLSAASTTAQIIPLEQNRYVSGFVIVPQCAAKEFMNEQAPGFKFFKSTALAEVNCELGEAMAASTQASAIGEAHLTALGTSTSEAASELQNVIHALADSVYEVTFQLDDHTQYFLSGLITAQTSNSNVIFAGVAVSLRDADDVVLLEHSVQGDPDGEPQVEGIADAGILAPGVYTFRASSFTGIDNDVPPNVEASALFELEFQAATVCPADLNDDGQVGPEDLALLLGSWGPVDCAGAGCPDFNQDGIVNAEDLAVLLGSWGSCA